MSFHKLSFSEGIPIAKVTGGIHKGKCLRIMVCDNKFADKEIVLAQDATLSPLYFQYQPDFPNRYLVCGASMSGKSYFASLIAKSYKKQYKKNKLILFSAIPEDPSLDPLEPYRIRIDESLLENPIEISELHDSMTVFDDIDAFGDKKIVTELNAIKDKVFCAGRHFNCAVLSCAQVLLDGHKTRSAILNCFMLCIFPRFGGAAQAKDALKKYVGLEKMAIEKIFNLPSRWVLISRVNPMFVMHEKGCFIL